MSVDAANVSENVPCADALAVSLPSVTLPAVLPCSLGVPVCGYRTSELPGFYTDSTGIALEHRFESALDVSRALRTHWNDLQSPSGVLLAVPPPSPLPRAEVEAALGPALLAARGLPGKQVTPFLLAALAKATAGRTQQANLDLLENNARVAAEVARALGRLPQ